MGLLFKFTGLLIIFLVCVAVGYQKSCNIRKRAHLLDKVYRSVSILAEYIKTGTGEISKILPKCFEEGFADITDNKINFKHDYLEKLDIDLLTEFFGGLGYGDKNREYERTKLYVSLIKKQSDEAEQKAQSLCKLYNSLGFLSGAFLCIFFI